MAISQVSSATPANETQFTDTAMGNSVDSIKASSAVVYNVVINNSLNASAVYVKLYNSPSGSVSVGSSVPDEVIYVPGLTTLTQFFVTGGAAGKTFGNGLSAVCVTTGGTAGIAAPSSSVSVTITYM